MTLLARVLLWLGVVVPTGARIAAGSPPDASPVTTRPASLDEWQRQRPELRNKLRHLLGDLPPMFEPEPTLIGREQREGYRLEKFSFDNRAGDTVYGYLLLPDNRSGKLPAILYHHAHSSHERVGKEEILQPSQSAPGGRSAAEVLTRAGYVVMCIDAYTFGDRKFVGPSGDKETGNQTEESYFKLFLWQGRSLWGMIVRDDLLALNYLLSRPEVDPQRVGAMGFSMGATRTWWAAALDERIRAAVSVACLTRYHDLIAVGGLKYHSIYYFVPGVLAAGIDAEQIVGLIAPRSHLTLTGDRDDGSPVSGVRTINAFEEHLYRLYGCPDRFRGIVYADTGHAFTADMWRETLAWFDKHLIADRISPPSRAE